MMPLPRRFVHATCGGVATSPSSRCCSSWPTWCRCVRGCKLLYYSTESCDRAAPAVDARVCPQAAYCWALSPYPRFLSKLLFWYMISLLGLFGAPSHCMLVANSIVTLSQRLTKNAIVQARSTTANTSRGPKQREQPTRSANEFGHSVGRGKTAADGTGLPSFRRRRGRRCVRCCHAGHWLAASWNSVTTHLGLPLAANAAAAASSAPGRLTSCAASFARRSSASASSRMSPPMIGCPSPLVGVRPSAAADIGRNTNSLPRVPFFVAALLVGATLDQGLGDEVSATALCRTPCAASPSGASASLPTTALLSALCASGLRWA